MAFKLKKRPYWWPDYLAIPFQCDPWATVGLGVQKTLTGFSAVIQVPVVAKVIDGVILAVQGKAKFGSNLPWFIILLFCVGWRRISNQVGRYFVSRLQVNAAAEMGVALTAKRTRLHYSQIEDAETWNLINRVCTKADQNVSLMIQRSYNLFLYCIRIFGVLFIVFTQVWWVGVLIAALCAPLIVVSFRSGERNYRATKKVAVFERRHRYLAEVLSGREAADERALFGFSGYVNKAWYEQFETSRKIKLAANIKMTASVRGGSMITTFLSALITVALIFPTAGGQITIGIFIALATSMYDLVNLVGRDLTRSVTNLSQFKAYLKELTIFAALEETVGAADCPARDVSRFSTLELKNVSFCYPGASTYILKNTSLKIEAGGHYAFVGVNGAGKTTITKLITGLYDNYEGEILINGKNLQSYTQGQLKALFCGIYQDFAKYNISARHNVYIGNINALDAPETRKQAEQVLRTLGIYNELASLPQGLDTPLGKILDGGVDISGGQWQKLAMARALISPAPILILDEPTAALDPLSESRLYEQFGAVSQGKTSIFISHRLGSTKLAHKIFVLDDGRVIEEGPHEALLAMDGAYARMYESQRSWYQ